MRKFGILHKKVGLVKYVTDFGDIVQFLQPLGLSGLFGFNRILIPWIGIESITTTGNEASPGIESTSSTGTFY